MFLRGRTQIPLLRCIDEATDDQVGFDLDRCSRSEDKEFYDVLPAAELLNYRFRDTLLNVPLERPESLLNLSQCIIPRLQGKVGQINIYRHTRQISHKQVDGGTALQSETRMPTDLGKATDQ